MKVQCLFTFLVSMLVKVKVKGDAQCTLDNGRCTYNVHLLDGCSDKLNPVQNDARRINDIEQTLLNIRLEHTKMISELENKISQLTSNSNSDDSNILDNNNFLPRLGNIHIRHPEFLSSLSSSGDRSLGEDTTFDVPDEPSRQENVLLYGLHDEFSVLRKELADAKRRLRETEKLLNLTRNQLSKAEADAKQKLLESEKLLNLTISQLDKSETDAKHKLLESEKLLNLTKTQLSKTETALQEKTNALKITEDKLTRSESKRKELKKLVDKKQNEVNTVREKLRHCKRQLKSKDIKLWELTSDVEDLRDELERCKEELAQVKMMLQKALIKYHDLNHRHENVTQELNDTKLQLSQCAKDKASVYCGFEDPTLCGYTVEEGNNLLKWIQWTMSTPSHSTGPTQDHTCGNDYGHYMYVEATTMGQGRIARLISPQYNGYQEQCVEFYYHMYGNNIGTLNVILLVEDRDTREFPPPVWRAFGNQGNVWTMARLSVPDEVAVKGYQVVFEVMTASGYAGDIAIDDIRIFDGECYGAQSIDQWRKQQRNSQLDQMRAEREKLRNNGG